MPATLIRICAWSGPAAMAIVAPIFWMMGFLPPPPAALDAAQVAAFYEAHRPGIRLGAALLMQMAPPLFFWSVAIHLTVRRAEEPGPSLGLIQLICGAAAYFGFVIVGLFWTVAAYRPDRSPDVVQAFNEIGWFTLVAPASLVAAQAFAIGIAILADRRARPALPRWAGFFSLWCGLVFLPGAAAPFVKTGPFTWGGLLVFWLGFAVFAVWLGVLAWLCARAAREAQP